MGQPNASPRLFTLNLLCIMAKKAMKGKPAMSKGAIADALAAACEKKKSDMTKALDALVEVIHKEVKSTGKFKIPGVCMIKTRHKPATKAGKRVAFGKEIKVKAKPARTIVRAFPVADLKRAVH